MLAFILQTVFLALTTFLIGWFLGRFIKGFFCKIPSNTGHSKSLKTNSDKNIIDSEPVSDASSASVVKTAVASVASAAVIAGMTSSKEDEKSSSINDALTNAPDIITKDLEEKVNDVVIESKKGIEIEEATADIEASPTEVQNKSLEVSDAEIDNIPDTGSETSSVDSMPAKVSNKGFDEISDIISGKVDINNTPDDEEQGTSESGINTLVDKELEEKFTKKLAEVNGGDDLSPVDDTNIETAEVGEKVKIQEDITNIDTSTVEIQDEISEIADSSELHSTTEKDLKGVPEILDDGSDNSSLADIAKATVVAAGAGIIAKAGADTLDDAKADEAVLDTAFETTAKDADESLVENKAQEVVSDINTLADENIGNINNEAEIVELTDKELEEKFTAKLEEVNGDDLSFLDIAETEVAKAEEKVEIEKDISNVDRTTTEVQNKTSEIADSSELNIADKKIIEDATDITDDNSDNSSLADIAKATAVAAGVGIMAKVGADTPHLKADEVSLDIPSEATTDESLSLSDDADTETTKVGADTLDNKDSRSDETNNSEPLSENQTKQKPIDDKVNTENTVFRRRNMRRFRSSRR